MHVPQCNQPNLSMQELFLNPLEQLCILSLCRGVAQGVGPEIRQNACQNGVLMKLSPGLPDQQRLLDTSSEAHPGGSGELRRESRRSLSFGKEKLKSRVGPSCQCSPGATPCTPRVPNLAGIPRKHAEQALILRLWPNIVLAWFPCLHHFSLPDALMGDNALSALEPKFAPHFFTPKGQI
eukprot:1145719-Pelagomonas_calceolata.AAC.4